MEIVGFNESLILKKGLGMRLSRALLEKKFDVRLRDKLVAEKKLSALEVTQYQESLPDETENAYLEEESFQRSGERPSEDE